MNFKHLWLGSLDFIGVAWWVEILTEQPPSHLSNIFTKLKLENRSQLVRFAFEHGYSPPQT